MVTPVKGQIQPFKPQPFQTTQVANQPLSGLAGFEAGIQQGLGGGISALEQGTQSALNALRQGGFEANQRLDQGINALQAGQQLGSGS